MSVSKAINIEDQWFEAWTIAKAVQADGCFWAGMKSTFEETQGILHDNYIHYSPIYVSALYKQALPVGINQQTELLASCIEEVDSNNFSLGYSSLLHLVIVYIQ